VCATTLPAFDQVCVVKWTTAQDAHDGRLPRLAASQKKRRYSERLTARIVGQPASTIDPAAWLRDGSVVVVNTARGDVGDNTAALIGSTLLNLVTLGVAEQSRVRPDARAPIIIFVDES
jgi:hypothetical protein